ncbi:MAG: hypothetical protein ACREV6_01315 [Clostridium sp.]|uniref:hypothetical protein n=1 Tax=Clostridium sp. TaxID=1506 RepID=UPI003D6CB0A6
MKKLLNYMLKPMAIVSCIPVIGKSLSQIIVKSLKKSEKLDRLCITCKILLSN